VCMGNYLHFIDKEGQIHTESNGGTVVGYMDKAFRDVAREPMDKSGILNTEMYQCAELLHCDRCTWNNE